MEKAATRRGNAQAQWSIVPGVVEWNLGGKINSNFGTNRVKIWATALWWIWKWCNSLVFGGLEQNEDEKAKWVLAKFEEAEKAYCSNKEMTPTRGIYIDILLRWVLHENDWFTLNVDGCLKRNQNIVMEWA